MADNVGFLDLNPKDRRIIVVASKQESLLRNVDWNAAAAVANIAPVASHAALKQAVAIGGYVIDPVGIVIMILVDILLGRQRKRLPFPVFPPTVAREVFHFPMNHPVDGVTYACADAEPATYVPISRFHQYMYESKISSFHELCASLGAKSCHVVYEEGSQSNSHVEMKAKNIPTDKGPVSGGVGASSSNKSSESVSVNMDFPEPFEPPKKSDNLWMVGEPTWTTMQKLRLSTGLDRYTAEFNYTDEMGIDANVAASITKIGLSIGGSFEKLKNRKWRFEVEFWPVKS